MTIYYISSGHKDGLGGNFRHLIKAYLYAKEKNYEFINYSNQFITNSYPFFKTFSIFSNLKKIRDIPDGSSVLIYGDYHRDEVIEYVKKEFAKKKFKYIILNDDDEYKKIIAIDYKQDIRELHQKLFHERNKNSINNLCKKDHYNIVLHIRRGDVFRKIQDNSRPDYLKRFTTDNYYVRILKKLIGVIPKNHHIILFSEGFVEEFDVYKQRHPKIDLQIDKESWRYIINDEIVNHPEYNNALNRMNNLIVTCANADFFVGSKSHLSHILGYLNKNLVFFESFFYENLQTLKNIYLFEKFQDSIPKIKEYVGKKA